MWNWLFRQTAIGQLVEGKKTWIGLLILFTGHTFFFLGDALTLFPTWSGVATVTQGISQGFQYISPYIDGLGFGTAVVGLIDKVIKWRTK